MDVSNVVRVLLEKAVSVECNRQSSEERAKDMQSGADRAREYAETLGQEVSNLKAAAEQLQPGSVTTWEKEQAERRELLSGVGSATRPQDTSLVN